MIGPTPSRNGWREGSGLYPHLQFYLQAFWDLSSDRRDGGPIPWTAIDAYARRFGILDAEGFDRFCSLLKALDSAWLELQARLREANRTDHGRP